MKYVRLKDNIIEVNPTLTNEDIDISLGKDTPRADTIEELCDWLVFRLNGKISVLYEDLDTALQVDGNHILIYKEIYGALDTDKGLIYVAKMNEKGELELL